MANFNLKKGMTGLNAKRFSGINVDKSNEFSENISAYNMRNFRITDDGSLKKRCGYQKIFDLPYQIRGVWNGYVDKVHLLVIVSYNKVYYMDINTNEYVLAGTLGTNEGKVSFLNFNNALYIYDSYDIYHCYYTGLRTVDGYAPLIKVNCNPYTGVGDEVESPNLLTRKVRARYNGFSFDSMYYIHDDVESFVGVKVDNTVLLPSEYEFFPASGENDAYVLLSYSVSSEAYVEIAYVRSPETINQRHKLLSAVGNIVCDALTEESRAFLYGYDGELKNTVYYSSPIDADNYLGHRAFFIEDEKMYFPSSGRFDIGEGASVTSSCRFNGKILFFTENDVWKLNPLSDDDSVMSVSPLITGVGSANIHGATELQNNAVFIGKDKIYELSKDLYFTDEVNIESISENIRSYISEEFCASAVMTICKRRSELWIAYNDTALIYNFLLNAWYCFDGLSVRGLCEINGEIAFYDDNCIFIFGEELNCDVLSSQDIRPIEAVWESGFIDFGKNDSYKRLHRCSFAILDGDNGNIDLEAVSDRNISCKRSTDKCPKSYERAPEFPKIYKMRMSVGRFANIKFILSSNDEYRPTVSKFSLYAQS